LRPQQSRLGLRALHAPSLTPAHARALSLSLSLSLFLSSLTGIWFIIWAARLRPRLEAPGAMSSEDAVSREGRMEGPRAEGRGDAAPGRVAGAAEARGLYVHVWG